MCVPNFGADGSSRFSFRARIDTQARRQTVTSDVMHRQLSILFSMESFKLQLNQSAYTKIVVKMSRANRDEDLVPVGRAEGEELSRQSGDKYDGVDEARAHHLTVELYTSKYTDGR